MFVVVFMYVGSRGQKGRIKALLHYLGVSRKPQKPSIRLGTYGPPHMPDS